RRRTIESRPGYRSRRKAPMRFLFWFCAALMVVSLTVSTNLWRELRTERGQAAGLRAELTEALNRAAAAEAWVQVPPSAPPAAVNPQPARAELKASEVSSASVVNRGIGEQELLQDVEYH